MGHARTTALSLVALALLTGLGPGCLDDGAAGGGDAIVAPDGEGGLDLVDGAAAEDTVAPTDTGTDTDADTDTATDADAATDTAADTGTDTDTVTSALSCAGRCDDYDQTRPCQCDASCARYGNCCADWADLCAPPSTATDYLAAQGSECASDADWHTVTHVRDGDTVDLDNGEAVRFLVMNTPETSSDDCYAYAAKDFTRAAIAQSGERVCLVTDPTAEDRDLYDRLLRYVYVRDPAAGEAPINLNLRLVRLGYARVYYPYAYGRVYEPQAKAMQAAAKAEQRGGWGSCGW